MEIIFDMYDEVSTNESLPLDDTYLASLHVIMDLDSWIKSWS